MNDLETYFYKNTGKAIHKFAHYFEIYERYFSRFRGRDICVVEIGVADGGSLQMWKNYFGPQAEIVGVDISHDIKVQESQIRLINGNQNDDQFLSALPVILGRPIDILIDDGSHINFHQLKTFSALFPAIAEDGIYLCEDVQTSYQEQFGGGYLHPGSFITQMKQMVDQLNAWCAEPGTGHLKTEFTRAAFAIHFYTYAVVIEKRLMDTVLKSPVVSGGVHVQQR